METSVLSNGLRQPQWKEELRATTLEHLSFNTDVVLSIHDRYTINTKDMGEPGSQWPKRRYLLAHLVPGTGCRPGLSPEGWGEP